jgi:hypothetical protein
MKMSQSPPTNFGARFGARRNQQASNETTSDQVASSSPNRPGFLARHQGSAPPAQVRVDPQTRTKSPTMTRETTEAFDRVLDMVRSNSSKSSRPLLLIVEELYKFSEKKGLGIAGKRCVAIRDGVLRNLAKGVNVNGEDSLTALDRLSRKAIELTEEDKYDADFMFALRDYISTVIEATPELVKPYVRTASGFKRGEKGRNSYTAQQLAEEFISENLKPTRINNYFNARLVPKKANTMQALRDAVAANKDTDAFRHREGYRALVKFIADSNIPALTTANVDVIVRAVIKPFSKTEFKETTDGTRYPSTSYRLRKAGPFVGIDTHRWTDEKNTEHRFAPDGADHVTVALHEYAHLVKFLFDKTNPTPVGPSDVAYAILADIPETQKSEAERD